MKLSPFDFRKSGIGLFFASTQSFPNILTVHSLSANSL